MFYPLSLRSKVRWSVVGTIRVFLFLFFGRERQAFIIAILWLAFPHSIRFLSSFHIWKFCLPFFKVYHLVLMFPRRHGKGGGYSSVLFYLQKERKLAYIVSFNNILKCTLLLRCPHGHVVQNPRNVKFSFFFASFPEICPF